LPLSLKTIVQSDVTSDMSTATDILMNDNVLPE